LARVHVLSALLPTDQIWIVIIIGECSVRTDDSVKASKEQKQVTTGKRSLGTCVGVQSGRE